MIKRPDSAKLAKIILLSFSAIMLSAAVSCAVKDEKECSVSFKESGIQADKVTNHNAVKVDLDPVAYNGLDQAVIGEIVKNIADSGEKGLSQSYQPEPGILPGKAADLGIILDSYTFFLPAPSGNSVFEADMRLIWSFSESQLSRFNSDMKGQAVKDRTIPFGALRLETTKSRFVRQIEFEMDLSFGMKWKDLLLNKVAEFKIEELHKEIEDSDKEFLGQGLVAHRVKMDLTDIQGAREGISGRFYGKLNDNSNNEPARYVARRLAERVFIGFNISLDIGQSTSNRYVDMVFDITAESFDGSSVNIGLAENSIRFYNEAEDYCLAVRIPDNCPPLKSVTLKASNAVYNYTESGAMEMGVSAPYVSGDVKIEKTLDGVAKYFPTVHAVRANAGELPSFRVDGLPVFKIPFHGVVQDGMPAFGIEGVKIEIAAEDGSFKRAAYSDTMGHFYGDFYAPSGTGQRPAYTVTALAEGYPPRNTKIVLNNDEQGYTISMVRYLEEYMSVAGNVLDIDGNTVEDADVYVTGDVGLRTVSIKDGKYNFPSVLRGATLDIRAHKTGYYIPPVRTDVGPRSRLVGLDLRATIQNASSDKIRAGRVRGVMNIYFTTPARSLPRFIRIRNLKGEELKSGYSQDNYIPITVLDEAETLYLEAEGYELSPSSVSASFSGQAILRAPEMRYDIVATPMMSNSIHVTPAQVMVEAGGAHLKDKLPQERARLTATVKNAPGDPMAGVPVRFEVVSSENKAAIVFSPEGFGPGCGYGMTDKDGTASVDISAYSRLGNIQVRAVALDKVNLTKREWDSMQSNYVTVSIVPSGRIKTLSKPGCSVKARAASKAVLGQSTAAIETGGEIDLEFSVKPGNHSISPIYISGEITGYKLIISRDNGHLDQESYQVPPPSNLKMTFIQPGDYKILFQVKEKVGDRDIWSELSDAEFKVLMPEPKKLSLNSSAKE